ncbi:MAG: hypothetical protein JW891_10300 [Candidatus Lokiarchaeota archaeon]|nr:hypothetical protein [Candidatus Lokiarchaeota archaeon]
MTNFDPDSLYREYQDGRLDRNTVLNLLESLIENSLVQEIRVKCVKIMEKIALRDDKKAFFTLENLMLSDSNINVRIASANALKSIFSFQAVNLINWALSNETDYDLLINLILLMSEINHDSAKKAIINALALSSEKIYTDTELQNQFLGYQKAIKKVVREYNSNNITSKALSEILINYMTIEALINKFSIVRYELENALVTELDLSEIGWNMNLWMHQDPNFVESISDITGLSNLKQLKSLNLSNNRLTDLKGLECLPKLIKLNLANNKIEHIDSVNYLTRIKGLRSLNLSGNEIVNILEDGVFGDIEVITQYQFL